MRLRSRRHRQGLDAACGCHGWSRTFTVKLDPLPIRVITGSFCDPVWQVRKRRKIHSLPDLAEFSADLTRFREAMASLGPVVERANETVREMVEVLSAEPE